MNIMHNHEHEKHVQSDMTHEGDICGEIMFRFSSAKSNMCSSLKSI